MQPTLPAEMFADMDATTFVVRGPSYAIDKVKVGGFRRMWPARELF